MGVDTQSEDFTVVGIGDMSGDVFGNGMLLLSKHIRLLAAFDHRHVFLDPIPTPRHRGRNASAVRAARSSWEDYDRSLISEGGGVFSRQQVHPDQPAGPGRLGIDADTEEMTPPELIRCRS